MKHKLMHLELLTSCRSVLGASAANFATKDRSQHEKPHHRFPELTHPLGVSSLDLTRGTCSVTTWPQFFLLLTQRVCRQGHMERPPWPLAIPAAGSPGFHQHHIFNAQHVSKTPQAVARETSLIMQMCRGMLGDSILSVMST